MVYHVVGHLARRGVAALVARDSDRQQYIDQLKQDAQLYDESGQEVDPKEILPLFFIFFAAVFLIWSINYALGDVIASLTMIESPSRTAIVESAPPPYTDEHENNKPKDMEPLLLAADPLDVEITVVEHIPITARVRTALAHIRRVGGFWGRWRGVLLSLLYHFLHNLLTGFLSAFFRFGFIGDALIFIFVSLGLIRVHMAWTTKMIAHPSSKWWWSRLPARKNCKALLLPTLVYAVAQQVTLILPLFLGVALGVMGPNAQQMANEAQECPKAALSFLLRLLAVALCYSIIGLAVLFPASVTLTRIEALLLPESEDTIVPFDKASIMGEIDLAQRGACRALFVQAWKTFDRASRWRLIKLYVKMVLAQVIVIVASIHLAVGWLYILGAERMSIFFKSASAQLKLMALGENQY